MRTSIVRFAAVAVALVVLVPAARAAINWQLTSSCSNVGGTNFGNTRTCTGSDGLTTVAGKAFSNTGDTGGGTNNALQTAFLGSYSGGFGATNRDGVTAAPPCTSGKDCAEGTLSTTVSPEHAVDNNERYDVVLFTFSDAINLAQVKLGYFPDDSDISVLAYTGAGTPSDLANGTTTYGGLTASLGWTLVGHYSNVKDLPDDTVNLNTSPQALNPNRVSSYWLIGAFNPTVGSDPGWTNGNDYVKLLALWGEKPTNGAPEPGGMALLATTLAALLWARGRGATKR
jgi:hypothetical protein